MISPQVLTLLPQADLRNCGPVLTVRSRYYRNLPKQPFPVSLDRSGRLSLLAELTVNKQRLMGFTQSWHPADFKPLETWCLEASGLLQSLAWAQDRRIMSHPEMGAILLHVDQEALVLVTQGAMGQSMDLEPAFSQFADPQLYASNQRVFFNSNILNSGLGEDRQYVLLPLDDSSACTEHLERLIGSRVSIDLQAWPLFSPVRGVQSLTLRPLPDCQRHDWHSAIAKFEAHIVHWPQASAIPGFDSGRALGIIQMADAIQPLELGELVGGLLRTERINAQQKILLIIAAGLVLNPQVLKYLHRKCSTLEESVVILLKQLGIGRNEVCLKD